jgi:outer membrane protein TolC
MRTGKDVKRVKDVKGFLVLIAALAAAWSGSALAQGPPQAPPPVKMEFDAVIQQALAKNPTVALAATNISRADTLLQQARAVVLPLVSTTVVNSTLDSARSFGSSTIQPQNQTTIGVSASMPILAATRWAAVQQARDQVEVATAGAAEIRQQIVVAAAQTYLEVIAARRQYEVTERSLESARAHLDYAQKRFEGGAGSRLNQLRAAQIVSSEESRLEVFRFAVRSAQEALGVIVVAEGPVDAGADPVFDQTGVMDEDAWRKARPDLVTQAAVQRSAERVLRDTWREWVPNVNASFDPVYLAPAGIFQPSRTWRFSISTNYPIFEGGQRRILKLQREISLDQTKLTMSSLEIQARSEVRLAQEAVQSRDRTLTLTRRAADEAAEVLSITTSAFEVGATTNLEVIDAQREARDADTAVAIAQSALQRARLELLVALGRFK